MTNVIRNDAELDQAIDNLAAAERITKKELGLLSRELLIKWDNDHQSTLINKLLGIQADGKFRLTPINWRVACMYFHTFIGAASNYEKEIKPYVTKGQGKRVPMVFADKASKNSQKRTSEARTAWLGDDNNDIWNWQADNINMGEAKDYRKLMITAVTNAMAEDKGNMSHKDVIYALLETDLEINELIEIIQDTQQALVDEQAKQAA